MNKMQEHTLMLAIMSPNVGDKFEATRDIVDGNMLNTWVFANEGDIIEVIELADDGWPTCRNPATNKVMDPPLHRLRKIK